MADRCRINFWEEDPGRFFISGVPGSGGIYAKAYAFPNGTFIPQAEYPTSNSYTGTINNAKTYWATAGGSMLDIFNLPDLTRWHSIGTGNFHFCSAFSPNGQYLYIGNAQWPMRFRMSDKNLVYFGEAAADTLRTLDVSPSGQVIVVGGWTAPRVERYDAASLLKLPNFNDLPTGQVRWVRYSPNGAYVGVCFNDQPGFALYDAVTRNRLHLGSGQVDSGLVCEFSPDSSKVAVISASNNANNRLIIVDINTWVGTYPSPNLGTVDAKLRFSSDGTKLYVAEGGYTGKVYVYNMSDLSRTEIILSPSWASVNSLCLSI